MSIKQEFKNAMSSHAYWLRGGNYYGERATFENADLSNICFDRYSLRYVHFNNCEIGMVHNVGKIGYAVLEKSIVSSMLEGTCENASFYDCKIKSIAHAAFYGCSFKHCNLRRSNIGYVTFRNCDFYATDFSGCNMKEVQFINCTNVPKNAVLNQF